MNNSIFNQKPGEVSNSVGNNSLTRDNLTNKSVNNVENKLNDESSTNHFVNTQFTMNNSRNISSNVSPISPVANQNNVSTPPISPVANQNNVSAPPISPVANQNNISTPPISPTMDQNSDFIGDTSFSTNDNFIQNQNFSSNPNEANPFVQTTPSGKPIINEVTPNNQETNNNSFRQYYTADDEKYLKAYIGPNFEKIASCKFSFPAFFLSSLYLYYRKMYLLGLVVQVLAPIAIIPLIILVAAFTISLGLGIFGLILPFCLLFIINIVLGLNFNKLYLKRAVIKVEMIKQKYPNNEQGILTACTLKGGTSIFKAILIFLIPIAISVIIVVFAIVSFGISIFNNLFDTSGPYKGIMSYGPEGNVTTNFSLTVPSVFERDGIDYTYDTGGTETFNECEFSFNVVNGYTSANTLSKEMSEFYFDDNVVENKIINGITWHSFSDSNSINKTYYNLTDRNNKVYLAKFEIGTGVENPEVCQKYYNEIMNSISYK